MNIKLLKEKKMTIIVIVIFITFVIGGGKLLSMFFPNNSKPVYGDRLNNIVEIKDDDLNELESKIREEKVVTDIKHNISGRTLNFIIVVDNATSKSAAKKIGEGILPGLKEEILKDYDIQIFISKEDKSENDFPIIGYKSTTIEKLSWTKDRKKIVEESE